MKTIDQKAERMAWKQVLGDRHEEFLKEHRALQMLCRGKSTTTVDAKTVIQLKKLQSDAKTKIKNELQKSSPRP